MVAFVKNTIRYEIFKVSSTLLNMEMKGVIRPLPGKLFEVL